jgi:hypothetical protein
MEGWENERPTFSLDELVKSRKTPFFVIPAEAGIQQGRRPSAGLNEN